MGKSWVVVGCVCLVLGCGSPTQRDQKDQPPVEVGPRVKVSADSDPRAIEIAKAVLEKMGGQRGWDGTRFVSWNFFGRRTHVWDRATGDQRLELPKDEERFQILKNVEARVGRVWRNRAEIGDPEEIAEWLQRAHEIWINDAYWMFMPYKLLDPGVTLKYGGERDTEEGQPAHVLDLTFGDGVGYTPQNRYEVLVGTESGLVEQWDFFADAADVEPGFRMPWANWKQFGDIMLATEHGRGADWEIAVHDGLPRSVFESPEPMSAAD